MKAMIAITLFVSALSCTSAKLQADLQRAAGQDPKDKKDKEESESVDPPANISGSFLHCAFEQEASEAKPEALLGCRFDDANGNRVAVSSIAAQSVFTYRQPSVASFKVYPKALNGDNRYDAVYLLFADTRDQLLAGAAQIRIFVQLTTLQDGGGNSAVSGLLEDVSIDVAAIPEARETDYDQVRDDILTEAQTNEPAPPLP